jgi:hypothetical protein
MYSIAYLETQKLSSPRWLAHNRNKMKQSPKDGTSLLQVLLSCFPPLLLLCALNQKLFLQPTLVYRAIKQPMIIPLEVRIPRTVPETPAWLVIGRVIFNSVNIERWNNAISLVIWIHM